MRYRHVSVFHVVSVKGDGSGRQLKPCSLCNWIMPCLIEHCGREFSCSRFPAGAGNFSLYHRVQNGSGTHPSSYPRVTEGSFPGSNAARA